MDDSIINLWQYTGEKNPMQEPSVCIVGGGPVGCSIAYTLAKNNKETILFEQQKKIGKPVQCAGLVTPRVFDLVPFSTKDIVQTKLKGAHIHAPNGETLSIGGNKTHAYCIDRQTFDQKMMSEAKKQGAEIKLNQRVFSVQKQKNIIELTTSKKQNLKTSLVLGADGPYSKIRDVLDFPSPKEFLYGIGATVTNTSLESDFVEIFVGNTIAPGFFAWMIPITKDGSKAKIGLCIKQNASHPPMHYFKKLFNHPKTSSFLKNTTIEQKIAGNIPLGPLKKMIDDNIMLAGDAAAQVKPTSGGGLYPGLIGAKYCAAIAKKAIEKQDFSSSFLQQYQEQWSKELGWEIKVGMQFRKIFTTFQDDQFNKYIKKFKEKNISEIITEHGDMDFPSKLAKPIFKKMPSLLKFLPTILVQH